MNRHHESEVSVRKILNEIIGVSPAMVRLRRAVRRIARSGEDVLIIGEPGVGKRFLAEKIHQLSARRAAPFHQHDCSLLYGRFQNGTLANFQEFLDDQFRQTRGGTLAFYRIETLSHEQQLHLLSSLRPVAPTLENGKNGKDHRVAYARVIATCELDEKTAIERKYIDAKLFYRLGQVTLTVPPLRKRKQDIPYLFNHFLQRLQQEKNGQTSRFEGISDELYDSLMSYDWHGNVEELQNSARSLILTAGDDGVIPETLPFLKEKDPLRSLSGKSLPDAISMIEQYLIKTALGKFEGNQTKAAQHLKISEASLRYKLKKYGIANR